MWRLSETAADRSPCSIWQDAMLITASKAYVPGDIEAEPWIMKRPQCDVREKVDFQLKIRPSGKLSVQRDEIWDRMGNHVDDLKRASDRTEPGSGNSRE